MTFFDRLKLWNDLIEAEIHFEGEVIVVYKYSYVLRKQMNGECWFLYSLEGTSGYLRETWYLQ